MKRKHQQETENTVNDIIGGAPIRIILVRATPGSGKSALPIIAGKLVQAGKADACAWNVPRKALQYQGERNFQDPFFRDMFKHSLQIRSSTNEPDPCRGLDGFTTTYQAIGIDHQRTVLTDFHRKRYVLTLDEFHHLEYGGIWHNAIDPIVKQAEYLLLMTGTMARGDGKQIAYVPYTKIGDMLEPDLRPREDTAVIEYTRQDALEDRAIIPLKFNFHDGSAKWKDEDQNEITVKSFNSLKARVNVGAAVYTALSTEYATELLSIGMDHWKKYKRFNRRSKLLIVTANIEHAKKAIAFLRKMNLGAEIATSHDSVQAAAAIKRFKYREVDILVTIAMAYEGLDVPAITHIICLTHIRSTPWIEQMVARAVRIDHQSIPYEQQYGYIFAPDDPRFRKIVNEIEAEQLPIVRKYKPPEQTELFEGDENNDDEPNPDRNIYNIIPIGSSLTGKRGVTLAHNTSKTLLTPSSSEIEIPSDIESSLREQIDKHLKLHCYNNRYDYRKRNAEVKAYFQKSRADMTIAELGNCLSYVQRNYPAGKFRGTNHKRVSNKVREFRG